MGPEYLEDVALEQRGKSGDLGDRLGDKITLLVPLRLSDHSCVLNDLIYASPFVHILDPIIFTSPFHLLV